MGSGLGATIFIVTGITVGYLVLTGRMQKLLTGQSPSSQYPNSGLSNPNPNTALQGGAQAAPIHIIPGTQTITAPM